METDSAGLQANFNINSDIHKIDVQFGGSSLMGLQLLILMAITSAPSSFCLIECSFSWVNQTLKWTRFRME